MHDPDQALLVVDHRHRDNSKVLHLVDRRRR
jgi:hypothetical protein